MISNRGRNIFLLFLFLIIFISSSSAFASVAGDVNHANSLYKHGKFDDALKLYQKALEQNNRSSVVKYDLGTTLYKKGDYAKAFGYLEQAARDRNFKIKPWAEYNLGNVLYRAGMQKEAADVNAAIKTLQQALGQYGRVLKQDPKDQDTLFNEGVVKKEIERLKKLKKQQQRQQQRKNQKQQQNQQHQQNQQSRQNQKKSQKQNQQQSQHSRQGRQKAQKQHEQQQSSGSQGQNQQKSQPQAAESQQELDRQQAERLLEDYRQNEEPRKLLNYTPQKIDTRPVLKDW